MRCSIQFAAGVVLAAALAGPACSDGPTETSSVEILHWWTVGGEADAIRALLDMFKKQNPSVKVVDAGVDGGSSNARSAIQNRMAMGLPPDTFQANGGWDLMSWVLFNETDAGETKMDQIDGWAQDWIPHVPDQVLASVSYTDPDPTVGNHVYGVPLNIHRLNTLFYNKQVFEDVGIDLSELGDLDGLFRVAEKIKTYNQTSKKPITPIALGYGQMQSWTLALLFFENLMVAQKNGQWYTDWFRHPQAHQSFSADIAYLIEDFRRLISYTNDDADRLTWDAAMDRVLNGDAAMTIMGDWAKGYANSKKSDGNQFGFMPTPGTTGTFVFTTDTFGCPSGADNKDNTETLLRLFGSPEAQKTFNRLKGSISARLDVDIAADDDRRPTYDDFSAASDAGTIVPATSILAKQSYLDAISSALAAFASKEGQGQSGVASEVQHALDNYYDVLATSCWPACPVP